MIQNLISIIVPSYNYESYIIECLKSIVNQEYQNIELIIIDDNSKDNSYAVINEYISTNSIKKRFNNIILEKNSKNMGAHYTINRGVILAQGEYIAIINSDDLYQKDRFKIMMNDIGNSDLAFSDFEILDSDGNILFNDEAEELRGIKKLIKKNEPLLIGLLKKNFSISTGNLLFKKSLYMKLEGFSDFEYIHDWDFILRAYLISTPVYVRNTKYFYRLHENNSFRKLSKIADYEVNIVLQSFFSSIKNGDYSNKDIDSVLIESCLNSNHHCYKYMKFSKFKKKYYELLYNLNKGGRKVV